MRDRSCVRNSDNSFDELNEYHIDMFVFLDLIKLRHHGDDVHVSDLLRTKVLTEAVGPEDAVIEFCERHELGCAR